MNRRIRLWWSALALSVALLAGSVACTFTVSGDPAPAPQTGRTWGSQAHTPTFPVAENPPE